MDSITPLQLTPVLSSTLEAVGYDEKMEIMDVKFRKGGRVERFFNVGHLVFRGLMGAKSMGQYFSKNIARHYQHRTIG